MRSRGRRGDSHSCAMLGNEQIDRSRGPWLARSCRTASPSVSNPSINGGSASRAASVRRTPCANRWNRGQPSQSSSCLICWATALGVTR
jgi:hypothetical protein